MTFLINNFNWLELIALNESLRTHAFCLFYLFVYKGTCVFSWINISTAFASMIKLTLVALSHPPRFLKQ